jgi:hypothetical protein
MTDSIDLDELDAGDDEADAEEPKRGDWLWQDGASPESPDSESAVDASTTTESSGDASSTTATAPEAADDYPESTNATESTDATASDGAIPHVPRENQDKPVGIPVQQGGAGAGPETEDDDTDSTADEGTSSAGHDEPAEPRPMSTADYHDADVDDMTMAITYNAVRQLADPSLALAQAREWADWIGIVGDVPAHTINKFQRENRIDADFFNGSGTDPGERLAEIDHNSMFFAERLVVVGVAGEDEPIASTADWEFVSLSEAAKKAGWELASS